MNTSIVNALTATATVASAIAGGNAQAVGLTSTIAAVGGHGHA
ncbi:hypothetical protein [Cupriavidus necator]